jgi:ubiquinone/menaquinone biosynthesis C-methylase UbiE
MSEISRLNPTGRFTGRAEAYDRFRPDYPSAALSHIVARCGLGDDSVLVDVGCGTGISTRLFAALGIKVIGIEPNDEMRAAAEHAASFEGEPRATYRKGQAESTGLPAAMADLVLAAQAFHWFEPEATLIEFHRILKRGGWAILMWNERDDEDPFTRVYSDLVDQAREATLNGAPSSRQAGRRLLASPLFGDGRMDSFRNEQALDREGLLGRAFSVSYAPTATHEAARWMERLGAIFEEHQRAGQVVIRYRTLVYQARRRS